MYSVSNTFSKAINADVRDVLHRVTLAGAIVIDRSRAPKMVIEESAGDTSGVAIGTANSSTLKLTLKKADPIDYNDILVEPESGLVLPDGSIEWIPLGKFWVTDFSTSNDYETVSLTCADGMYHLTGEYISKLTYPTDISNVMNEISAQTGVAFVSSLPTLSIRVKPEGMTYREVVGYLAGCCGKNARFNRQGQLEFFWYEDSGVTIGLKTQYLDGMTKLNNKPLNVNFEVVGQKEMYSVTCIAGENGGLTASPGQNVLEGETVVLSVNPFYGYELADISAVTDAGNKVTLYKDSEGGRTFAQPDSNVTVTASFRSKEGGALNLTLRTDGNGTIRANKATYTEGETAYIYVRPNDGYEFDKFTTIPTNISFEFAGTVTSSGEKMYTFTVPKSDVTVTVSYKKIAVAHSISKSVPTDNGIIFVQVMGERDNVSQAYEGTMLGVTFLADEGYTFDHHESSIPLVQTSSNSFTFTMPDEDISFTAWFKLSVDESKVGQYSWLALPANSAPPTQKPYWAVFYNDSETLPTCQKYYLMWFDSWEAISHPDDGYKIRFNGYYYCGSKNNGHGNHEWDTSSWSGNGASGSTLEWNVYVDRLFADWDDYYGVSSQYCLVASNVHLYYRGDLLFENCESSIRTPQTSYLQGGMDVREKGSLTQWLCPDTFSTPAPAANWMVLMPEGGLYMTVGEDGKYNTPLTSYPSSLIAFFYDGITIENIGSNLDGIDGELYIASFTNARWTYLRDNNLGWDEAIHDLPEGAVVGLRSPLNSTLPEDAYVDGNSYNFAGVLVTSKTLYDSNGNVFMYANSCRICDCATEAASTFMLRRTRSVVDAEAVTIKYENPLIYEKMVSTVTPLVHGITYTPARVKHRGNPAFQVGDIVTVPDKDGNNHTVLIMQQTMNFGGGMNAEITSPGQTEKKKSFASRGSMTVATKREVQQSNLDLERRLSANSSLVYAALYKTIGSSEAKIESVAEWQTENGATISLLEQTVSEHSASLKSLTEWQDNTNSTLASIEETVSSDSAKINLLSKYSGFEVVVNVDSLINISEWDKKKTYYVTELDTYFVWGKKDVLSVYSGNGTLNLLSNSITATTNGTTLVLTSDGKVELSANDGTISISSLNGSEEGWNEYYYESIASIAMKTNNNAASLDLFVKNGEVQAGIIMEAINNDKSSIKISADQIDIDGVVTALEANEISVHGSFSTSSTNGAYSTTIEGGTITVDAPYTVSGEGMFINTELLRFKILDKTYALSIVCNLPDTEYGIPIFSNITITNVN